MLGSGEPPANRPAFHDRLLDAATDELPYARLAPTYLDRLADSDEHGQAWLAWLVEAAVEQRLAEEHLNAVAGLEWDERLDY